MYSNIWFIVCYIILMCIQSYRTLNITFCFHQALIVVFQTTIPFLKLPRAMPWAVAIEDLRSKNNLETSF